MIKFTEKALNDIREATTTDLKGITVLGRKWSNLYAAEIDLDTKDYYDSVARIMASLAAGRFGYEGYLEAVNKGY